MEVNGSTEAAIPVNQPASNITEGDASAELQERFHYKQELKRGLGAWQLTGYGVNYMGVLGGGALVGVLMQMTGGNATLPYIFGMIVLFIVAGSYAALVPRFPLAGSAYNYVSKGLNPYVGFLTGWVIVLDYVLFPSVALYFDASYLVALVPSLPLKPFILVFAAVTLILNLIGIDVVAKLGLWLLAIVVGVLLILIVAWGQYIVAHHGAGALLSAHAAFSVNGFHGLSQAVVLTLVNIVGFDALTTLVEESRHPKKDIPRAMYGTIAVGVTCFIIAGYMSSLVLSIGAKPGYLNNPNLINSPFYLASMKAQGQWLATLTTVGFEIMSVTFGMVATAAASRLLFGMGRDRLLPKAFFGAINKRFRTPHWNILFITAIVTSIALWVDIVRIFSYINFGAVTAFFMVQITAMWVFRKRPVELGALHYGLRYQLLPLVAIGVLIWLYTSLQASAWTIGPIFLGVGVIYLAAATKGFRKLPPELEV